MSWERGRDAVEQLLGANELERVTPSDDVARRLIADAEAHITLASRGIEDDPAGALQLSYDAARKAAAALLAVQGLRATSRGGHIAVIEATSAQFSGPSGIAVFRKLNRLRRRRNSTEYPDPSSPGVTPEEARHALGVAEEAVAVTTSLLATGRLDAF